MMIEINLLEIILFDIFTSIIVSRKSRGSDEKRKRF